MFLYFSQFFLNFKLIFSINRVFFFICFIFGGLEQVFCRVLVLLVRKQWGVEYGFVFGLIFFWCCLVLLFGWIVFMVLFLVFLELLFRIQVMLLSLWLVGMLGIVVLYKEYYVFVQIGRRKGSLLLQVVNFVLQVVVLVVEVWGWLDFNKEFFKKEFLLEQIGVFGSFLFKFIFFFRVLCSFQ